MTSTANPAKTIAVPAHDLRKADVIVDRQGLGYAITGLIKTPGEPVQVKVSRGSASHAYSFERETRIEILARKVAR